MSSSLFVLLATVVIAVAYAVPAPLLGTDSPTAVPGQYIVIFKSGLGKSTRDAHVKRVRAFAGGVPISERNRFQIGNDFAGYSAKFSNTTLQAVRNLPEVAFIEQDQTVHVGQTCVDQFPTPSWGLNRVSATSANALDGTYTYDSGVQGAGVTAYMLDSGIYTEHQDFGTRAIWGENFADTQDIDCSGHGTHVAGIVGGTQYGLAKEVSLVAVKVLNCGGTGTWAAAINGVAWAANDHQAKANRAVANMSLQGYFNLAMNQAIAAAVGTGITFVVAAGNGNNDACTYSPASEPTAIAVVATTIGQNGAVEEDVRASFSNYGTCTDIAAPGQDITAPWIGAPNAIRTVSGTSMAAPHVCGVAALVLEENPTFTPAQVFAEIQRIAAKDIVDMMCGALPVCNATPNRFLSRQCGANKK